MNRSTLLATGAIVLVLAGCGGRHDDASADATPEKAATAQPRQPTVFDDQLKALDKAKAVDQQVQDAKARQDAELQRQENGG